MSFRAKARWAKSAAFGLPVGAKRIAPVLLAAAALAAAIFAGTPMSATAQGVVVRAAVETESVYMGESFLYQIEIDGSDEITQPDITPLRTDFTVEPLGGRSNNSQSISIINGKMQREVHRGYVFQYRLTPRRKGALVIPAIAVKVKGQEYRTNPIQLGVNQPVESQDFKLRMSLSRGSCYVGEPVVLTVTWYIGRDVRDFRFTMPPLEGPDFDVVNPEVKIDPNRRYYQIELADGQVIGEKGTGELEGQTYATISFRKALFPKRAGTITIPQMTVECSAVSGTARGRDFFDDFFNDNFFGMARGALKRYVVPSNTVSLTVRDLPAAGRPPDFAGLVGDYKISASASPTDVSVGDPITLRVTLSGPDFLGKVNLPPLQRQAELNTYFKIPDERAEGKVVGRTKVFTQTIRAKSENVKEIPPVTISFFDTKSGSYRTASTDPIPISVRATHVVTAAEAEGTVAGPLGSPLESWKEGIAYNYEGPAVLRPQTSGLVSALASPLWLAAILVPPVVFISLFTAQTARRRREENFESFKARGAYKRLRGRLEGVRKEGASGARLCELVLAAMREYLGDRLVAPGATLTTGDVERLLREREAAPEAIEALRSVMSSCEAGTYAGDHSAVDDPAAFIARAREAAERLERTMR